MVERISDLGTNNVSSNKLLVTANVVSSLLILYTLMTETILSSFRTPVLIGATRGHIPEDGNFVTAAVKISNFTIKNLVV
jgi:hypothetical protein